MRIKKFLLVAALAAIPALGACDGAGDPLAPGAEATATKAPTSRFDPATGEPVALNAPTADRVFTVGEAGTGARAAITPACPIDDPTCIDEPCDPIYDWGCEPCPTNDPAAWCYQPPCTIASIIDTYRTQRSGDEPSFTLEANGVGSTSCGGYLVLIGIGMRMDESDNITTLHLKYQRVYSDGTFGATELRRYGPEPTHSLEAYAEALPGEGIVGIGVGSQYTHNINTIRIWKRPLTLTSSGVRTTGSTTAESFGPVIGGTLDFQYYTTAQNEVYVGAGARGHDHEVKTFAGHIGTLK